MTSSRNVINDVIALKTTALLLIYEKKTFFM